MVPNKTSNVNMWGFVFLTGINIVTNYNYYFQKRFFQCAVPFAGWQDADAHENGQNYQVWFSVRKPANPCPKKVIIKLDKTDHKPPENNYFNTLKINQRHPTNWEVFTWNTTGLYWVIIIGTFDVLDGSAPIPSGHEVSAYVGLDVSTGSTHLIWSGEQWLNPAAALVKVKPQWWKTGESQWHKMGGSCSWGKHIPNFDCVQTQWRLEKAQAIHIVLINLEAVCR